MDGSSVENSDSDSGESWIILDNSPAHGEDAPNMPYCTTPHTSSTCERDAAEKDEDTDGISIISDSDHESSAPCEMCFEKFPHDETRPTEQENSQFVSISPVPTNSNDQKESIRSDDDFLGDNNKHKIYVHRRNKRLSTVLNIIMLGSVITAAGVAIGHMWGAKNDCAVHTTPSVNKILSNLYKLQEENAYLRNKLKELTIASSVLHIHQLKEGQEKLPFKHRCKKVYEEPLTNKNPRKITKCVDMDNNSEKILESHLIQPEYEKEFLNDIDKLKHVYQQNKSWLDDEVAKRIKREELSIKKMKSGNLMKINEEQSEPKKELSDSTNEVKTIMPMAQTEEVNKPKLNTLEDASIKIFEKISYADSLKSDRNVNNILKENTRKINDINTKDLIRKKRSKKHEIRFEENFSEDDLKKDDRNIGRKANQERKKNQKSHKNIKRQKRDKWNVKGELTNDYDDISISTQDSEILSKPDKNYHSQEFEKNNYVNQFYGENVTNNKKLKDKHVKKDKKKGGKKNRGEELDWYEKRAAIRSEARRKLENELFGDGETSPNDAEWYFRRMQKREQCRAKRDNNTLRKFSRRIMNFKMKH